MTVQLAKLEKIAKSGHTAAVGSSEREKLLCYSYFFRRQNDR